MFAAECWDFASILNMKLVPYIIPLISPLHLNIGSTCKYYLEKHNGNKRNVLLGSNRSVTQSNSETSLDRVLATVYLRLDCGR